MFGPVCVLVYLLRLHKVCFMFLMVTCVCSYSTAVDSFSCCAMLRLFAKLDLLSFFTMYICRYLMFNSCSSPNIGLQTSNIMLQYRTKGQFTFFTFGSCILLLSRGADPPDSLFVMFCLNVILYPLNVSAPVSHPQEEYTIT